jgi:hypothetical protein
MKTTAILTAFLILAVLAESASGNLTPGWQRADVGATSRGDAGYDSWNDIWTVTGDGWDIQSTGDAFHFAYQGLFFDGQITARVVSITGAGRNEWTKAGVMIREDLTAGSRHALMALTPGAAQGHAAAFQWRATANGVSASSHAGSMALPYWVRLERTGDTFKGYLSADGITWTQQGTTQTISMGSSIYMGLAVTSHSAGTLCTATFDHVTVGGQWQTVLEDPNDSIYRFHIRPFAAPLTAIHSHLVATGTGPHDTDWVQFTLYRAGRRIASAYYGARSPDADSNADVGGEHDSLYLFSGEVVDYIDVQLHQWKGHPTLNRQRSYIRDYYRCAPPHAAWGAGGDFDSAGTDRACFDTRQDEDRLRSWVVAKGFGCNTSSLRDSVLRSFDSLHTERADVCLDVGYAGTIHRFVPVGFTGQAVYDVKVNADIGPAWNQQTHARTLNRWNYGLNEFAWDTVAGAAIDLVVAALDIPGLDFVVLAYNVASALTVEHGVAEAHRAVLRGLALDKDQEYWAGLTLWAKVSAAGTAAAYVNFFSPDKMSTDMGPLAEYLISGEKALAEKDRGLAVGGVLVYYPKSRPNGPPNTPTRPSGPAAGATGASFVYSTWAVDPDGDQVKYAFDWGDGTQATLDLGHSGTIASATHVWNTAGVYLVKAMATDEHEAQSGWSATLAVTITQANRAPNKPSQPSGPTTGSAGIPYTYAFSATDGDGDSVKYTVDWGDGTRTTSALYPPPGPVTVAHTWTAAGIYLVKVMATDEHGLASSWSDALAVTIQARPNIKWERVEYRPTSRHIGDALNLRGTYANASASASVPAFKIAWEVTRDTALIKSGNLSAGGLSPGGSGQFDFACGCTFVPGSHQVKFTLDPSNQVAESDETDNVTTVQFSVEAPSSGLRNGGFDEWGPAATSLALGEPTPVIPETPVPTYWTLATGNVHRVTGKTRDAVLLGGRTTAEAGAQVRAELLQFITPAYSPITIAFDAYGDNPWGPLTARVELYWYDAAGTPLPTASFSVPRSTTWKHYSFPAYNPGGGVYLKINLVRASWGYVVFDNLVVAGGPPL